MQTIDVEALNEELARLDAAERIAKGVELFGDDAVLLSSMQKTASVLMHMFHTLGLSNEILFVDTGYHFSETLMVRDEFMRRYRLNVVTLYPTLTVEQQEAQYGCKLYQSAEGQPRCCDLRKTQPFLRHMKKQGRKLVFGGLRRQEGGNRSAIPFFGPDPRFGGYKMNPLADWTSEDVDAYLAAHDVPVHPLHAMSYPSIGCACCTTPVLPGEDERAGRWRHLREGRAGGPAYCGMNFTDGSGI